MQDFEHYEGPAKNAHVIGTCAHCGFRFDLLFGTACPRCRIEGVKSAFAPIDSLRTALGIGMDIDKILRDSGDMHDALERKGIRWHGPDSYLRSNQFTGPALLAKYEDAPEACKIPTDEAAQIYELRRMFRL